MKAQKFWIASYKTSLSYFEKRPTMRELREVFLTDEERDANEDLEKDDLVIYTDYLWKRD